MRLQTWARAGGGRPGAKETKAPKQPAPLRRGSRSADGAPGTGEPYCPFPATSPSCTWHANPLPPRQALNQACHTGRLQVRLSLPALALTNASLGAFLGGAILLGSIFSCESSTRARAWQADSSSLGLHPCGEGKAGLAGGSPAWAGSQPPAPTCVGAATRSPGGRRRRDGDA